MSMEELAPPSRKNTRPVVILWRGSHHAYHDCLRAAIAELAAAAVSAGIGSGPRGDPHFSTMPTKKHCLMGSPRRVYGTLLAGKNARLSGYEVWGPVHTHPDSQQAVARRALRNASLPDHRHGAPGGPVFFIIPTSPSRPRRRR